MDKRRNGSSRSGCNAKVPDLKDFKIVLASMVSPEYFATPAVPKQLGGEENSNCNICK